MSMARGKLELSKEEFANAIETVRSGLYIVTTMAADGPAGCTAVWVCRVSFAPPLMGVVLSPMRYTYRSIEASGRYCINVLGESSISLARQFGFHGGPPGSKFKDVGWKPSPNGSPLLEQAISWFDCDVHKIIDTGDHKLVTGEVVAAGVQHEGVPAVYYAESFFADDTPAQAEAAQ